MTTHPSNQPLTVSELTREIKDLVEGSFPAVWVRGEISNLRRQSSGHIYFSLKDSASQAPCAYFKGDVVRGSFVPRDGMQVVVFGRMSVYEPRGCYQFIVRFMAEDGVGRLQQEFERLKKKLADEGLFDSARKRALPSFPRTVGVITSPTGAALRDFLSIVSRRNWRGRLVLLPVRVQGNEAAPEIVARLEQAAQWKIFDLLIVTRGGGSLEDLWPFNEEIVARAIAGSPIPVISAVGHEIDFSLSDFAADLRAETPSAAAELITSRYLDVCTQMQRTRQALVNTAASTMRRLRSRVDLLQSELRRYSPRNRLENLHLVLDELETRLRARAFDIIAEKRHRLHRLDLRSSRIGVDGRIRMHRERLRQLVLRLEGVSPQSILNRGFTILRDATGGFIQRCGDVRQGMELEAEFADGRRKMVGGDIVSSVEPRNGRS